MKTIFAVALSLLTFVAPAGWADESKEKDTVELFRNAGTGGMIDSAHGYAVFPSIGKGGIGIGGANEKAAFMLAVSASDSPACLRSSMACSWVDRHTARLSFSETQALLMISHRAILSLARRPAR